MMLKEVSSIANIPSLPGFAQPAEYLRGLRCLPSFRHRAAGNYRPSENISKSSSPPATDPHVINGIAYVNDSKATNGDSAERAVSCYGNIYLIAGGQSKEGGLSALEPYNEKMKAYISNW